MKKRILALVLVLCMVVGLLPVHANAAEEISSGMCGQNLYWVLTDDGTLTISGEGKMEDYSYYGSMPTWYDYRSNITKLVIQPGVTSIGNQAFMYYSDLTEISIPDSVESIGMNAFDSCTSLISVEIPFGVKIIRWSAFANCYNLENVSIPSSVTEIGAWAFEGCSSLKEIIIPDSVTNIESSAFRWCTSLTAVEIPNSVMECGENLFESCTGLKSIKLPNNLLWIGRWMFSGCTSLRSVIIPESVITIFDSAFEGCASLSDIYYEGSKEQWQAINKEQNNDCLKNVVVHCNSMGPGDENDTIREFNEFIYRAAYIADTGSVTDYDAGNELYLIDRLRWLQTPGRSLQKAAQETGYGDSAVAWHGFKLAMDAIDNPTSMITEHMKQQDVYTAILLSAFGSSMEIASKKQAEDFSKEVKEFADSVNSGVKSILTIDLWDQNAFRSLDTKSMDEVCDIIEKQLKKDFPKLDTGNKICESISIIFNLSNDFLSFCQNLCAYAKLYTMSDTMKAVLRKMDACVATDGSQFYLSLAIDDCLEVISYAEEDFINNIVSGEALKIAGSRVLEVCIGKYWNTLMTNIAVGHPAVGSLLAGAKVGVLISEYLFSTSKMQGKYFELCAVIEIEALVDKSLLSLNDEFMSSRTEYSAKTYLDAIDIRYALLDMECAVAKDFVSIVDSTTINQFEEILGVGKTQNAEELQNLIEDLRSGYQDDVKFIQTNWIRSLQDENPELYLQYCHRLGEKKDSLSSIYTVACPVDIFILDPNGQVIASAENEVPWGDENITISVEGGVKTLHFFDDSVYEIICVGYDDGEMDISIRTFENGNENRQIYFYGLPLHNSTTYTMAANPNIPNTGSYEIKNNDGVVTTADYDSNDVNTPNYTVKISNGYIKTPFGATTHYISGKNESIHIFAYVPNGYQFLGWEVISGECFIKNSDAVVTTIHIGEQDVEIRAVIVETPSDICVTFVGASLSLKGDIGLNFFAIIPEEVRLDPNAVMRFTVGSTVKSVPLSQGTLDPSDGSYRYSIPLNAKNMGDNVTAQVFVGDTPVGGTKTLSIKYYADYVINNSSKANFVNLMKAMLNYGAAAQVNFGYDTAHLVNADMSAADRQLPATLDVSGFAHTWSGEENGIEVTSASLLLQSETKIRIYFKLKSGYQLSDFTFTVDGVQVTPVQSGDEYYIEKANVAAKDLDTMYTFRLGNRQLTYCGLSYVNQVLNYSRDEKLINLAKALYAYNQAANAYFGA